METAIVFFDEDCGFCRWSAERLRAWDRRKRLRFASIRGPEGDRWLGKLDAHTRAGSWHLVTANGRLLSGAEALPPLLRRLPGGRPLAAAFAVAPSTTEHLYRWAVRHRGRLGEMLGQRACATHPERDRLP